MQDEIRKAKNVTFYLSPQAIDVVKRLSKELSEQGKMRISDSRVVELALFYVEKKNLKQLLNFEK